MGFKDKLKSSALNIDEAKVDDLKNHLKNKVINIDNIDPCSDNPFNVSFKDVLKELQQLFTIMFPNTPIISATNVYFGNKKKGGMSEARETAKYLEHMKGLGVTIDAFEDGTPNIFAQSVFKKNEIRNEEYRKNMKVTMALRAGGLIFKGVGASAAGPVDVTGQNINFPLGYGGVE